MPDVSKRKSLPMDADLIKTGFSKRLDGLKGVYLEVGKGAVDELF